MTTKMLFQELSIGAIPVDVLNRNNEKTVYQTALSWRCAQLYQYHIKMNSG